MLNENSNRSVSNAGLGDRALNGVRDLVGAFALGRDCKLIVMNSHEENRATPGPSKLKTQMVALESAVLGYGSKMHGDLERILFDEPTIKHDTNSADPHERLNLVILRVIRVSP